MVLAVGGIQISEYHEKEVDISELPEAETLACINTFKNLDKRAFEHYQNVKDDELDRKKRWDSYKIRLYSKWGTLLFGGFVSFLFFIASFSSYMGWISDKRLGDSFLNGVIASISVIVGFALGAFYEQSKVKE